jgi:hypothetical protein
MTAVRGTCSISANVEENVGIAAAFKIDLESVSFAAMASAADLASSQEGKVYTIAGSNYFGKQSSDALPDYGMYLKTQNSYDSFEPTRVTFDNHALTVSYAGGAEGQYVVVQAYRSEDLEAGDTVYAAAQMIGKADSSVAFPVFNWNLTSLNEYTIKVWMEDASDGSSLAPATAPATFFGFHGDIVSGDEYAVDNLRVFAMKEELQTSWGDLKHKNSAVGENPTNQKIYFGIDANGAPLQFWIAGRETYSAGKSPKDGDGTLSADGDVMTLYQAKAIEARKFNASRDSYKGNEAVILILESGQRGARYPLDKVTAQTSSGEALDKSTLSWEHRKSGGAWKSGMPKDEAEYEVRCYIYGTSDYEKTYSAPVLFASLYAPGYRAPSMQAQEVLRGTPLGEVSLLAYDLGLPSAGGQDIAGFWEWVDPSQSVGDVGEKTFAAKFIQTGPGEFDWYNYDGTLQVNVPVRVMPTPTPIGSVELSEDRFVYDGKAHTPTLTVKDHNGQPMDLDTYFNITLPEDAVNAGQKQIVISFKENYTNHADSPCVLPMTVSYTVAPTTVTVGELSVLNKIYDGTDAAEVEEIAISGTVNDEVLQWNADYTVTAVRFEDAIAGNGKKVFVTVELTASDKAKNYTFAEGTSITVETTADIGKATPNTSALKPTPTLSALYGQTLGDMKNGLAEAIGAYLGANGEALSGTWSWEDGDTVAVGNVGEKIFYACFTPNDTTNYDWSAIQKIGVTVTVNPKTVTVGELSVLNKIYDGTDAAKLEAIVISGTANAEELQLGTDYTVTEVKFEDATAGNGKKVFVTVALAASDKAKNYTFAEGTSITVETAADIGKALPMATVTVAAKHGQTLGDLKDALADAVGIFLDINGEVLSGTWSWEGGDTATVGEPGENTFYAVFTPDNSTNYDLSAHQKIRVTVAVSAPEAVVEPSSLGAGAIVAIVMASVAVVGLGSFAVVWFAIKKKTFADLGKIFKK